MAVCLEYQKVYFRPRARVRASHTLEIAAALMLLAVLSTRVWLRSEVTGLGYELAALREEISTLDLERRELELQLSVMQRPDALAARARAELSFQEISPAQIVRLKY